jgi:hypothetical protein
MWGSDRRKSKEPPETPSGNSGTSSPDPSAIHHAAKPPQAKNAVIAVYMFFRVSRS